MRVAEDLSRFVVVVDRVTRDLATWNGESLVGYVQAANKKDSLEGAVQSTEADRRPHVSQRGLPCWGV
jgi:hypothetical protein